MNCQLESIFLSMLTTTLFIVSLYVYPNKLPRNDPFVIKTRFIGICVSSVISLYILGQFNKYNLNELSINVFDQDFLVNGLFKPMLILVVIQAVPILMLAQEMIEDGSRFFYGEFTIIKLRDYLLAPFTEELVYRYILLKALQPCFSPTAACLISSFLFGFSHFHHYLLDRLRDRTLTASCCQFAFSFLFGIFAASMYLKSTYIITPFILHAICNLLTLPDFDQIGSSRLLSISTMSTFSFGLYLAIKL